MADACSFGTPQVFLEPHEYLLYTLKPFFFVETVADGRGEEARYGCCIIVVVVC